MFQKYSLEVVSHHRDFSNKVMRQYYVDGINTIGAYGDEPFEVRFKNHTSSRVQVKLSIDGTDLLTGDKATTEVSKDMWVVQAYGTLNLKAWPETHNGGAALIFTSASNSVAVHTHGDLSSRGIIAAAVFEEGHVEPPQRLVEKHYHHYSYPYFYPTWEKWYTLGDHGFTLGDSSGNFSICTNNNVYASNAADFSGTYGSSSISCNVSNEMKSSVSLEDAGDTRSRSLESVAAVGAGEYVNQKITYTTGLTKPVFAESVRLRYLWWDDLVAKLTSASMEAPHGSGFPGDKPTGINLGKTPRIGNYKGDAFPKKEQIRFQPTFTRV